MTIALVGNPNTGKSTVFNALCGVRQRVGNYPGVTVEKKIGRASLGGRDFDVVDLPGSYSLAPRSPDEMIAVDVLLHRREDTPRVDVVVCIVDASNLERNLYLLNQVLELGLPTVLVLNMVDTAREKGLQINVGRLRQRLPIPVVSMQAHRRVGIEDLKAAIVSLDGQPVSALPSPFPVAFQEEVSALESEVAKSGGKLPRYLVERMLLDTSGYLTGSELPGMSEPLRQRISAARKRLAEAGIPVPAVESMSRYEWANQIADGVVTRVAEQSATWSDRVDRVLTHKIAGTCFFAFVMLLMFQSVYSVAEPASVVIDALNSAAANLVRAYLSEGALQSLLIDGVIEGVGGVLVFLPQILLLFLFIAVLEDCGYMARAAYLMDRVMSRVGLSGKSFIPLLSSFACAVPGIMSTRVIENRRDRLLTILIAPLMSCSARLPVYTLLIGAFIPNDRFLGGLIGLQGLTMLGMYGLGIVTAVIVAFLLRKTLIRGSTPPFIMELPSYRIPGLMPILHRVAERGWEFVQCAGTLILAVTILVWAAAYYPRDPETVDPQLWTQREALETQLTSQLSAASAERAPERIRELEQELDATQQRIESQFLQHSYLGRAGRFIEPLVQPLGWDWRIGCAVIASFPAREVVIATLAVIYHLPEGEADQASSLGETLQNATLEGSSQPAFTIPVALSIMVFFALCAQCASTLIIIRHETQSWRWPLFTFVYMTALAYLGAWVTFQLGTRIATWFSLGG
jgi:ferrous iron transport protein B